MTPYRADTIKKPSPSELLLRFSNDFIFKLAKSNSEKNRVYHLRHQVYCQEIGYTPLAKELSETESDIHDNNSIHCLIEHKRSGISAGCFRLVLPAAYLLNANPRLPLQDYGGESLNNPELHPESLPYAEICEISRFATAREFRNKPINHETLNPEKIKHSFSPEEKKVFPLLTTALFLATHALVHLTNRRHIFAMMDPKLPRLLAMSGFKFHKIGDTIELHGKRNAYYIDNFIAEKEMHEVLRPMYQYIKQQLSSQLKESLPHDSLAHNRSKLTAHEP